MSKTIMLRMLDKLQQEARTAADIERQAREAAGEDVAVITERVGGGRYAKSLRVSSHVMDLKAVTKPADGEQRYVLESEA